MRRFAFMALVLAVLASAVSAQVEPTVSRTIDVFSQGADPATATPVRSTTFTAAQTVCGQTKVTITGTPINPTKVYVADPADATKDCVIDATSFLGTVPAPGTYILTTKRNGATTVSPRSAASNPFERRALAPAADGGVRVGG